MIRHFVTYTFTAHGNIRIKGTFIDLPFLIKDNDTLERARLALIAAGASAQVGSDTGRCEGIIGFHVLSR